jgi:ABC-type histidine transport system ATPase subunit
VAAVRAEEAIGLQMHSCVLQQHLSKSFGIGWAVVQEHSAPWAHDVSAYVVVLLQGAHCNRGWPGAVMRRPRSRSSSSCVKVSVSVCMLNQNGDIEMY